MKLSYWGKTSLIITMLECGILITFQGIFGQPFHWAAIVNVGAIGFFAGFTVRSFEAKQKTGEE